MINFFLKALLFIIYVFMVSISFQLLEIYPIVVIVYLFVVSMIFKKGFESL